VRKEVVLSRSLPTPFVSRLETTMRDASSFISMPSCIVSFGHACVFSVCLCVCVGVCLCLCVVCYHCGMLQYYMEVPPPRASRGPAPVPLCTARLSPRAIYCGGWCPPYLCSPPPPLASRCAFRLQLFTC